jgi:tetratricopeptide (TPR) repeat protein
VCCFTLATYLAPIFEKMKAQVETSGSPLAALVGESREMFANQFFSMADVYFHSGYYPTIFDGSKKEGPSHLDVASHEEPSETNAPPDDDENFLGKPKDWIDRFGRNFFPTVHTHLGGHHAEEILPWLKLSAEMDPKHIDTYVTAAYWLRTSLNKPNEAEEFLREGLRENPDSAEILLELGRIYFYNRKEPQMARNLWEIALANWTKRGKTPTAMFTKKFSANS